MPTTASMQATARPISSEVRVPCHSRDQRSWPMELVPSQWTEFGGSLRRGMPVSGSLFTAKASNCPGRYGCKNVNARMISTMKTRASASLFLQKARKVLPQ